MDQADLFEPRSPTAVTDSSAQEINILLLGATGVGKSTFINALYNYRSFPTLHEARDAALKGEIRSLIYSEFVEFDSEERKGVVVKTDPNERVGKSFGSSCTQKCKAYTFNVGETLIQLIDTPGIGDTRGFDQDVENFKGILSFISRYEKLNAICILLKPNEFEERLTTSLKYCIVELLSHLHKDAAANILFCFTNARSTLFRPRSTKKLLQVLLKESPQTESIKLDKSTMYHFDSEGFRFLACVANGLKFSDDHTITFSQSWEQSTKEAWRLIAHISSLEAHVVERTLWSPTAVTDSSAQEINILLLGATGVGKSTFINALNNYLSFSTLGEALKGEIRSLIYSEFFSSTEDDDEERKIIVGKADPDEGVGKSVGSSCTQRCKAYTFNVGETLIRLIDTPGIGDTRGFDQDVENFKGILSYISGYEKLNAICILLKPNEERLTTYLKYCIVELLSHLHKDAAANILFCFTNARSTLFRPGSTKKLLQVLLKESPQTESIKLDKSTMYHFDSEGFRFLACVANGLKFSDDHTITFSQSWEQSTKEAWRLIAHISSLEAHVVERTLWSPTAVTDSSAQEINILLLGATGVGKSTFINALNNYLSFSTLGEALKGEIRSLIYSEFFSSTEDDDEERKIIVGKADPDEGVGKSVGSSCTQRCKAYTFNVGETLIRLIDTPGIGDTRGFDQDVENFKGILSYISGYEKLNAICILLKPNEERLTTYLKYCIVELLSHLHKDAAANILFCFTNARSTLFRPGSTKKLLQVLLKESPQTESIKLDKSTMYHFDSEGFRFLACVANGLKFSDDHTITFSQSWEQSTKEAWRLIDHIFSLEAHVVESTVFLNRVRDMLAACDRPLAQILAIIQTNLDEVEKVVMELVQSHGSIKDHISSLIIKESVHEIVALGHFRTICTSPKCKDVICHDHCSPHETILGMFASSKDYFLAPEEPSLFCSQLSRFSGECKVCGCPNDKHTRVSTEIRTVVREREDKEIRKVIDETKDEIQQKREVSKVLKQRAESIKKEREVVIGATAIFACFLLQNSITYHSATQDCLRDLIKMKKMSRYCSTPEGQARIKELEGLLKKYEEEVENFKIRCTTGSGQQVRKLTTEDVKGELEKLYALNASGESLRIWMDDLHKHYILLKGAAKREEVSFNLPRQPIDIQAASKAGKHAGPRGLSVCKTVPPRRTVT